MHLSPRAFAACAATTAMALAGAAPAPAAPATAAIEAFLAAQAGAAPGAVRIHLEPVALPACADPQPFLPSRMGAWGRVTVGVRCTAPQAWSRYVVARVEIEGRYVVAARGIAAGQPIADADLEERTGDLTQLPRTTVLDPARAAGMVAVHAIAAGTPLRPELLRAGLVIQPGQTVRAVAAGAGFVATVEARALAGAAAGALVQLRTADGRVLTGTARADGSVSVGE